MSQRRRSCIIDVLEALYLFRTESPEWEGMGSSSRCLLTFTSLSGPCLKQVHHVCVVVLQWQAVH